MAREEAIAPSAATAAATKNNEQKIRRNCDGGSVRFGGVVIQLSFYQFLVSMPSREFDGAQLFQRSVGPFEHSHPNEENDLAQPG